MTAINVLHTADAVHIATDGLCCSESGDVSFLRPKIYTNAIMPLALAGRGPIFATGFFGAMFCHQFGSLDELVARIDAEFSAIFEKYLAQGKTAQLADPEHPLTHHIELIFAGWSAARRRGESYYLRPGERLQTLKTPFARPMPSRVPPPGSDIDSSMVALMEAQRADYPKKIGAFCLLTTLTQDSVTQRILKRWN